MAYNLESLVKILEQILLPSYGILDPCNKLEAESLLEKALFLKHFFEKNSPVTSDNTESLESRIRDATYEAEDILESHMADQIHSEISLHRVIEDFDSVVDDIKKIMDDGSLSLNNTFPEDKPMVNPNPKNILVGIDEVSTRLKDRLTGHESNLWSIPIVGMGGIGKTTLARNAYDDAFVISHFHTRAWITISQHKHKDEQNLKRILLGLLGCLIGELNDGILREENDQLAERLYKILIGRRYLIVLDDMWVTDDWDDLRRFFPNDENGSRIMVTTRELCVANYAASNISHLQMHLLDEHESWNLLRQKVVGQEACPPELEIIGRKIAKDCRGLPLAVHVIGGVLSQGKRRVESWLQVAKDVSWIVANEDEQCSRILSLSYKHLPIHLKPCFLYMGAFAEDAAIRRSRLIRLWVAEGFVKAIPGKSLEEAAGMYLKALVDRNLIYVREEVVDGMVKSYSIHDLLRDLCLRKASQEKFLHFTNRQIFDLREEEAVCLRRVSEDLTMASARSILLIGGDGFRRSGILSLVFRMRLLKVLDNLKIELRIFPAEMVQLISLRYLAFSCYKYPSFSSISSLTNLETIIVRSVRGFSSAWSMNVILEMPRLRHVSIKRAKKYTYEIPGNGEWSYEIPGDGECCVVKENLQSLTEIIIDEGFGQLLKSVPNLKKLGCRSYSENIDLSCLLGLETFKCSSDFHSHTGLLFILPPSLKMVTLARFLIQPEHLKVIGNLPNLQVLKLQYCKFEIPKWEPLQCQFSRLQFLLLFSPNNLENWVADETNFPKLERLVLRRCTALEGIPIGIGDIPTLKMIEVYFCSDSVDDSARRIQEEQLELGNYDLQVRITP